MMRKIFKFNTENLNRFHYSVFFVLCLPGLALVCALIAVVFVVFIPALIYGSLAGGRFKDDDDGFELQIRGQE